MLPSKPDYATQSYTSDPGPFADRLASLPTAFPMLAQITQGLIFHFMAGSSIFGYCPPPERMGEIDTRTMARMLTRIIEMDPRPLNEARNVAQRLVGCCRDFSLLACAILRQHSIPARLRYGFADYFESGYWIDQVIVETWDGTTWQRFDPQMHGTPEYTAAGIAEHLDGHFLTGGVAWQHCRTHETDPDRFGLGSAMPDLSGWPFIRTRLLLDAAALDKHEMLCWDQWGVGKEASAALSEADEALLDHLAALTCASESTAVRDLIHHESRISVPTNVISFSPVKGPHEVNLARNEAT